MPMEQNGTKVVILRKREISLKYVYIGVDPPTGNIEEVYSDPNNQQCYVDGKNVAYYDNTTDSMRFFKCSFVENNPEITELKKTNGELIHKRITISFNANGGSGSSTQIRTWGSEQIVTPHTPSRSGHTFKGWFTASSGGTQVYFPRETPNANITYYAQWDVVQQTLKWRYKGTASTNICFCNTYNPIGDPCSNYGETMTICGADIGESDRCSILECSF